MDALWSAATVKLLGAGLDDADFVQKISTLVGQHDVRTPSISRSKEGTSRSYSYRLDPVLPRTASVPCPRAPPCSSPPVCGPP